MILIVNNHSKAKKIDYMEYGHKNDIDALKKSYDFKMKEVTDKYGELNSLNKQLAELNQKITSAKAELLQLQKETNSAKEELKQISNRKRCLENAPNDVYFADNGMPIRGKANPEKPYGDFTVYINRRTGVFHTDPFCSFSFTTKDHIFNVISTARPCKKCAEDSCEFSTVPDWFVR